MTTPRWRHPVPGEAHDNNQTRARVQGAWWSRQRYPYDDLAAAALKAGKQMDDLYAALNTDDPHVEERDGPIWPPREPMSRCVVLVDFGDAAASTKPHVDDTLDALNMLEEPRRRRQGTP